MGRYQKTKKNKGYLSAFFLLIFTIGCSYGLYFFKENVTPVVVYGTSMSPTLRETEKLIMFKTDEINRFDIISFESPDSLEEYYIKRVIGLPGDSVEYSNDTLYINGKEVAEPYLDDIKKSDFYNKQGNLLTQNFTLLNLDSTKEAVVPEGMLFVLGDNRIESKDSRFFGFISQEKVVGKMLKKLGE